MSKPFLIVIKNFLTEKECNRFKQILDYDPTKKKIKIGKCTEYFRVLWKNKRLASKLFERVKHHLPNNNVNYVGCNPMFRIAKYQEGGQFEIHMDGVNKDENGNISTLTLNIFLNDNFDGGETDFFHEKKLRYSVKPETGKAALFEHKQYHCGNKVCNGEKYLLRTDIMTSVKNKKE